MSTASGLLNFGTGRTAYVGNQQHENHVELRAGKAWRIPENNPCHGDLVAGTEEAIIKHFSNLLYHGKQPEEVAFTSNGTHPGTTVYAPGLLPSSASESRRPKSADCRGRLQCSGVECASALKAV
ncbi:hypothetical protein HYFRA_00001269 [Hymenoscyphus fraxineus]|uniref:Uncharacterized protein n=1 Tax=Hymenoscyphus fraxineus TaxID=746836 RepID=A0A9N9L6D7_9HELO|nr:hypothetical protein HYFRA_00001269 [Hymenoscyphus fraxineus]